MNITYLSDTLPRCDKWTNRIAIAPTHCHTHLGALVVTHAMLRRLINCRFLLLLLPRCDKWTNRIAIAQTIHCFVATLHGKMRNPKTYSMKGPE